MDQMTPRDHFAAKAMQCLLKLKPGVPWPYGIDPWVSDEESQTDLMAQAAYIYADAMMRARAQKAE